MSIFHQSLESPSAPTYPELVLPSVNAVALAASSSAKAEGVKGINSYVTATVAYLAFSWMGGEGVSQAASITVAGNC